MLSAINPSVSFGENHAKTRHDSIKELENRHVANTRSMFGASATILLADIAAVKAIKHYAAGKSFGWNKVINNFAKNVAEKAGESKLAKPIKNMAEAVVKTSGRQKLVAGVSALALLGVLGVVNHFAKENGKIEADLRNIK